MNNEQIKTSTFAIWRKWLGYISLRSPVGQGQEKTTCSGSESGIGTPEKEKENGNSLRNSKFKETQSSL